MDELLEQFLIEGRELVAQASKDLVTLERDPGERAALDSAFRAIHTLKGSAAILALDPAEALLHAAEDILERARKGRDPLAQADTAGLVACVDQTDRWLDTLEATGALPGDAAMTGARIAALLSKDDAPAALSSAAATGEWIDALVERDAGIIADAAGPLTAFRYTPDADSFFRGEDPLAIATAVPELLSLSLLPRNEDWPVAEDLDPFVCISILEGVSSASQADLRAAFRFQPDQVVLTEIAPSATVGALQTGTGTTALRVDVARIDALAEGFSDLVVAVNGLARLADETQTSDHRLAAEIRAVQARIDRATATMGRHLNAVRMVPLEPSLRRLPRLAREIAQSLGKDAAFAIEGQALEVDKQIADSLFEPLLHLIRNAIDHGLEAPELRAAAGKPATGSITLSFRREGEDVVATLADDGAGIDPDVIRALAVERGLVSQAKAAAMSRDAALRLIFAAGFSTAGAVTEVSGRGVGMDVVRTAIEQLRGTIDIESAPGRGTLFRMRLPANALTSRLLVVEVGAERFGILLDQVIELVRVTQDALLPVAGGVACVLRGKTVPVLDLATLLDRPAIHDRHVKLVLTQAGSELVALRVADFAERIDTIVRPPDGLLASARHVAGSALLGDGGVLVVLNLPELAE